MAGSLHETTRSLVTPRTYLAATPVAEGRGLRARGRGYPYDMADMDKAKNKVQEIEGRAKQVVGDVTGDESTHREGRVDEAKGNLKQAGEKVKDALHRD